MPAADKTDVVLTATSFPRSAGDWQGIFIRKLAESLGSISALNLKLWAPQGPIESANVEFVYRANDLSFLSRMTSLGGIANIVKNHKFRAPYYISSLLFRLFRLYRHHATTDIFHINWLQNAIPLIGSSTPAVITVLGTDFKMLNIPGMTFVLRAAMKRSNVIIAPNAQWMVPRLQSLFADVAEIRAVPFGVDLQWYEMKRKPAAGAPIWLCVSRLTRAKVGPLFNWGETFFKKNPTAQLHLFGPMQEPMDIPDWVRYHGPATPETLKKDWFPAAYGLLSLSRHSEGRPQVMLEAMAAGLPVVASPLPAHRDLIVDGVTGAIANDEMELTTALERLSHIDINLETGLRAQEYTAENIGTWQDCAARFQACYTDLLANPGRHA